MKHMTNSGTGVAAAAARLVLTGAVTTTLTLFAQAPKVYAQSSCPSVYRYRASYGAKRLPTDAPVLPKRYYRSHDVPKPKVSKTAKVWGKPTPKNPVLLPNYNRPDPDCPAWKDCYQRAWQEYFEKIDRAAAGQPFFKNETPHGLENPVPEPPGAP